VLFVSAYADYCLLLLLLLLLFGVCNCVCDVLQAVEHMQWRVNCVCDTLQYDVAATYAQRCYCDTCQLIMF
jgi:hypothetical protein